MSNLARLNVNEVRPLVMQMLRDKDSVGQREALTILVISKDKETLPQIRKLMRDEHSNSRQQAVEAYLVIDGGRLVWASRSGTVMAHTMRTEYRIRWWQP